MSGELPKRLFKEGEEPQVTQINNNCRLVCYMDRLKKWLPKELKEVKKDPVFAQIFKLYENGLGYSARVIHSFLCRELVTYKNHELWFVFARRPLRLSLLEFHAVTGLQCNTSLSLKELVEWEDDGGFWSTVVKTKQGLCMLDLWKKHQQDVKGWSNADRLRLVYLCIIVTMVCGRDEKANIPIKYVNLVMDLEKFRSYPWGVAAFDLLCESVGKIRDKLKDKTSSYVLDGFSFAIQIWAMEAVPKIGKLCGRKLNKIFMSGPRCVNWSGAAKISYGEIIQLENIFTPEDVIYPYISWGGNYDVVESAEFNRVDEVNDDRIKLLMMKISTNHDFSEHIWEFEETPEFSFGVHGNEEHGDDVSENDEDASKNDEYASKNDEDHVSDEDFVTPRGRAKKSSGGRKGKKRLPDRGMEKRKQKVLSTRPEKAPFNDDMKSFVAQLFEQNFSAMEARLQKQMSEKFEKLQSELKGSLKDASVVEPSPSDTTPSDTTPSNTTPSKTTPSKTTPGKPSTSKTTPVKPQPRRSNRLDENETEAEDMDIRIDTQDLENLSQASEVPGFDPSQSKKDNEPYDWWTPMSTVRKIMVEPMQGNTAPQPTKWNKWQRKLELSDSPMLPDGSPQSSLYWVSDEAWDRFNEWSMNPTTLRIGPTSFNVSVAARIIGPDKWLGNELYLFLNTLHAAFFFNLVNIQEMDAFMYIWRVKTSLRHWTPDRVAFMPAYFCLQIETAYQLFLRNKKAYELPDFLLAYGRGELPSHGRTNQVWGVDVDRLYFPLCVNGNHWIAVCINIIEKTVQVLDSLQDRQYVEKFAVMIPRIIKAVAPPEKKKHLFLEKYSIVETPLKGRLNKSGNDCGAYALKHLECHLLGVDLSIVDDELIMGFRQKIVVDIWEAAQDPILIELMTQYVPSNFESSTVFDLVE